MNKHLVLLVVVILPLLINTGCDESSDDIQSRQQEKILKEGTMQVGMPAIKNFRERKMLKDILELRDQTGLTTYTYIVNINGDLKFLGETIGYGVPYATQFTNPMKMEEGGRVMPQADPNGLFSPSNAEGTWVLIKDPHNKDVKPVYIEPRIIVSPFKLSTK